MFCIKCGKELQEQWKSCPYCGNDLNNSTMGQTQENKFSNASRLGTVKGVFGIVVVLLVATLILYWTKNDNKIGQTNTENQSSDEAENTEGEVQLSYEIYTDTENGLLYSNAEGQITNKEGDVISNYSSYSVTENGYVSDGECCLEGLAVNENGKLYVFELEEVQYDDEPVHTLSKLKMLVSESKCAKGVLTVELEYGNYTQMEDDGSYFDEVVLDAWYDENGVPLAEEPPKPLAKANIFFHLERFAFINGENYTFDMLKRSNPNELYTYAMILTNISKATDKDGNSYFQGTDYFTYETVIVHGEFNKLLNGDNLLVFATYTGTATDDTPNFDGFLLNF